jgi:hypothetical protein
MKVHLKKYALRYIALSDYRDPEYHPARALNYYHAHQEEIDFILQWWKRIREERERRMVIKLWRKYLTEQKS